jgi:hypothetical protein
MATTGCGISHKDTKHADKYRKNKIKTTQTQYDETTGKYFSKYCEDTKEIIMVVKGSVARSETTSGASYR